VDLQRLADNVTDAHPWIQGRIGVLEDHLHVLPEAEQFISARSPRLFPRYRTSPPSGLSNLSSSFRGLIFRFPIRQQAGAFAFSQLQETR